MPQLLEMERVTTTPSLRYSSADRPSCTAGRPVLERFVDHVIHLGPLGSGQQMKVINNALCVGNLRLIYGTR